MAHPGSAHRPTIRDVAQLAGVSTTTVSFVLNDASIATAIPEVTKERVRRVAKHIGYRPNATARLLRTRRSHALGLITDEVASTPFAGGIISGAQSVAWASAKILMIVNTGMDRALLESAAREMLERQVEGIVYAAMWHHEVELPNLLTETPCVLLNCFEKSGRWTSVVPDEVEGGRAATDALLQRGHRRIGFVNLPDGIPASVGRLRGYREALEASGVEFEPSLVNYGEGEVPEGYERAGLLLDASERPTALFCGNDRLAMGAYEAAQQRGLRIPEDLAVVGFDNQEIITEGLRPRLSSVALPHAEMGAWAIEKVIEGPDARAPQHYLMKCPLISRDSV